MMTNKGSKKREAKNSQKTISDAKAALELLSHSQKTDLVFPATRNYPVSKNIQKTSKKPTPKNRQKTATSII